MALETPEEFYARVAAATDDEGRLQVAVEEMPGWFTYPYELRGSPLLDWEENLPPVPAEVVRANAEHVGARLAETQGGSGPGWLG